MGSSLFEPCRKQLFFLHNTAFSSQFQGVKIGGIDKTGIIVRFVTGSTSRSSVRQEEVRVENLCSVRPVVIGLLRQAWRFREKCDHSRAAVFYRAAIAADQSPLAQIEYAAFLSLEDAPQAEELLLEGWEVAKRQANPTLAAQACHNLACLYRERGEDVQARQFQQLAISAELQAMDSGQSMAISEECRLGTALDDRLSGDSVADRELEQHLRDSADPSVHLALRLNLAMLSFQNGERQQAVGHARAAVGAAMKLQQPAELMESLHLLGRLLINDGRWHEARACLQQAADWANILDRSELASKIRNDISMLRSQMRVLTMDPVRN